MTDPELLHIEPGAVQGAWTLVGAHHLAHAPAGQHGGQHTAAGADVKRHGCGMRVASHRGQGSLGHQVDVLAPHRRKHPVVRIDAVAGRGTQGGHFHAHAPPLLRTGHAQQLAQRHHVAAVLRKRGSPGFGAGLLHIGGAAQGQAVIGRQRQQQHAQNPRTLGLGQAVPVKGLRHGGGHRCGLPGRFAPLAVGRGIATAAHGLQQLAGILKITFPQHGGARAGLPVGHIGGGGVIGHHHPLRWHAAPLAAPAGRMRHTVLNPMHLGMGRHVGWKR